MDTIPLELAEYICTYLSTSELIALSQQSRRWASFTLRFRFASLRIVFCEPHLRWLQYIIEETANAEFVQQLNIFANVVPQYTNISEYQWAIEMEGAITTDEAERWSGFEQYRRTLAHHLRLRASFGLKNVVDRLPNLRRVKVSSGSVCGCVPHRPFRSRALASNCRTESLQMHDVFFLEQFQSVCLESFILENLEWESCFVKSGRNLENLLQPWIARVGHLSLSFVTQFIQADTMRSSESTLSRFNATRKDGIVKRLVDSGAADLQDFELHFRPSGIFGYRRLRASLVIPGQQLRRLVLTNVSILLPSDDSLFVVLGQTLEYLQLRDIYSDAWIEKPKYGYMHDTWGVRALFHLLVRDLRLKEAHFGGHFWTYTSSPKFLDVDIGMGPEQGQTVGHHLSRLVVHCPNPELSETENGIDVGRRIDLVDKLFRRFRKERHRGYWVYVKEWWCPEQAIIKPDGFPGILTSNTRW